MATGAMAEIPEAVRGTAPAAHEAAFGVVSVAAGSVAAVQEGAGNSQFRFKITALRSIKPDPFPSMKKLYTLSLLLLFSLLMHVPVSARATEISTAAVYQDTTALFQYTIPEKPDIQTSVYDYAMVLKDNEKKALEEKLLNYADTTSTQVVIVTVKWLMGESIGELTPRWAHQWGIGQSDKDNGVFILVSQNDRQIWIAPGYGVDDRLTAGILGQMIRDVMLPEFKTGNYYTGLDKGTDAVFQLLEGKYKATEPESPVWAFIVALLVLFFLLYIVFKILRWLWRTRNDGGGTYSSSSSSDDSDSSSYTSSGKSSSGSSRSGFRGGFGGGGFSGGGAGGSW
jgi:uncharacterized protein